MNRGYKIVRRLQDGKLVSMFAGGPLRVQYIPGQLVRSPHGPLMVKSHREGEYWWHYSDYYDEPEIWICEYEEYGIPTPMKLLPYAENVDHVRNFWADPFAAAVKNDPDLMPTPDGTILAQSVRLLRQMEWE